MIKKIKLAIVAFVSLSLFAAPLMVPAAVYAADEIEQGLCSGANLNASSDGSCDVTAEEAQGTVNNTITFVINTFSIVVGVAAVIMIIVGGFRYIISGGDSGNVQSAKNTILFAVVGLVVVALSQFIVKFVLSKVSSATT